MSEVVSAAMFLDREHPSAKVIIITGDGPKAFVAGELGAGHYTL